MGIYETKHGKCRDYYCCWKRVYRVGSVLGCLLVMSGSALGCLLVMSASALGCLLVISASAYRISTGPL